MFKSLKDVRRRVVETVLEGVGVSERTVDEEFELYSTNFSEMIGDMNECGAGLSSVLTKQKDLFVEATELASALAKIYTRNAEIDWPNVSCQLEYQAFAIAYRDCWTEINSVFRTSAAIVSTELALQPLFAAVTSIGPEIDQAVKERNAVVIDFDSHKRRLKALEMKRDTAEAQGKNMTAAYFETQADIARFTAKLQASQDSYNTVNENVKKQIKSAKVAHDSLLDSLLITIITCQAELFSLAAKRLEALAISFPQAKVNQVRKRVQDYIKQGGVQAVREEKSAIEKGLAVISGKVTLAELKDEDEQAAVDEFQQTLMREKAIMTIEREKSIKNTSTPVLQKSNLPPPPPPPQATSPARPSVTQSSPAFSQPPPPRPSTVAQAPKVAATQSSVKSVGASSINKLAAPPVSPSQSPRSPEPSQYSRPIAASATAASITAKSSSGIGQRNAIASMSSPSAANTNKTASVSPKSRPVVNKVVALFDHTADADDELNFRVGDIIEVTDAGDDGWWTGRCQGKEGLFPANYVKKM